MLVHPKMIMGWKRQRKAYVHPILIFSLLFSEGNRKGNCTDHCKHTHDLIYDTQIFQKWTAYPYHCMSNTSFYTQTPCPGVLAVSKLYLEIIGPGRLYTASGKCILSEVCSKFQSVFLIAPIFSGYEPARTGR